MAGACQPPQDLPQALMDARGIWLGVDVCYRGFFRHPRRLTMDGALHQVDLKPLFGSGVQSQLLPFRFQGQVIGWI